MRVARREVVLLALSLALVLVAIGLLTWGAEGAHGPDGGLLVAGGLCGLLALQQASVSGRRLRRAAQDIAMCRRVRSGGAGAGDARGCPGPASLRARWSGAFPLDPSHAAFARTLDPLERDAVRLGLVLRIAQDEVDPPR